MKHLFIAMVMLLLINLVHSQEVVNVIKNIEQKGSKLNDINLKNYSSQLGILPVKKNYKFRGSSVWGNRNFRDILKKKYTPYYENEEIFAIDKGSVIEIFPK